MLDASKIPLIPLGTIIEDCLTAGITATEIADEFKVNTHTVGRWRSGRSVPMPFVCQVISKRLAKMLLAKSECSKTNPCCDRANEYNGFSSGPLLFICPKGCPCHD